LKRNSVAGFEAQDDIKISSLILPLPRQVLPTEPSVTVAGLDWQ
jgi:hypothetical protein